MQRFIWEEVEGSLARDEISRFRYTQYFASHSYLPGTDQVRGRVWLPHDEKSRHFTARDACGSILAVATATKATEEELPASWKTLLELKRLSCLLPETMVVSRTIVARDERNSALFGKICLRLASLFLEEGYHYAVHYCAPAMVFLYERLGYRLYGSGQNLNSQVFRLPMLLVADDTLYFQKVRSPFRKLARDPWANQAWIEKAHSICPELDTPPLCLRSEAERRELLRSIATPSETTLAELVGLIHKGALFRLRAGDVLAPSGVDEGQFLLLSGSLSMGDKMLTQGDILSTGSAQVQAKEDSEIIALPAYGLDAKE